MLPQIIIRTKDDVKFYLNPETSRYSTEDKVYRNHLLQDFEMYRSDFRFIYLDNMDED